MKPLAIVFAALIALGAAASARAGVLEVTTSVAVSDADDHAVVKQALQTAVDGALQEATPFKPTVVVVTRALVVGQRLYMRILLADEEAE